MPGATFSDDASEDLQPLLEVREDVTARLGDRRRARVSARLLPRAVGDKARVRAAAPAHRTFLTSYLLRVLAWKVILGSQGVVNSFLFWTGLRDPDDPVSQLLYSQFAVVLVLVYVWVPFVALPIFVSLEEPRPAPARGGERPGREPLAGVLARDAAARASRRRRGVPLRLHPDGWRVHHTVARRRYVRLHVRERDSRSLRDEPRLADRLGARPVPARRGDLLLVVFARFLQVRQVAAS